MDRLIIAGIVMVLVPCAVFALRIYMIQPSLADNATCDTERLETIVSAILDRKAGFDEQRKTVKELALSYREVLNVRDEENGQGNVIQFFDHRSNQDKIRKI